MAAVLEENALESPTFFAPANDDALDLLVAEYDRAKQSIFDVADFFDSDQARRAMGFFFRGQGDRLRGGVPDMNRVLDIDAAVKALDANYWQQALALTDVEDFMPAKRRMDWHEQIHNMDTPPFEHATVRDNIASLLAQRGAFLAEMVDGIFRGLSGEHVTNRPEGFSKRMIIANCFNEWGSPERKWELIHDLRCVIARFMARGQPQRSNTRDALVQFRKTTGEWHLMDGGAFRVRTYLKGTAHMEVHPDLAWRLNDVLSQLYPAAIPPRHRRKPRKQTRAFTLLERPIPFDVINIIDQGSLLKKTNGLELWLGTAFRKLDKAIRGEVDTVLSAIGGVQSDSTSYRFDYDVADTLAQVCTQGTIPNHKSYQYYPTPEHLARLAVEAADIGDNDNCLEPQAGQGHLAQYMPADRTTCVEVSDLHCRVLESKSFDVEQADFMDWGAGRYFDRIVMNPPFSEGRAQAHVEHAAELLAGGGRLVAIVPAGLANKDVLPGLSVTWSPVYENQFANASVDVVIMTAQR